MLYTVILSVLLCPREITVTGESYTVLAVDPRNPQYLPTPWDSTDVHVIWQSSFVTVRKEFISKKMYEAGTNIRSIGYETF